MKARLILLCGMMAAGVAVAAMLLVHYASPTEALKPKPVQPFAPEITTGMAENKLSGAAGVKYNITVTQGTRLTMPTFFSSGFPSIADKDFTDGDETGTVEAMNDILCNGLLDYLIQHDAPYDPYVFKETTTNVDSDGLLGTDPDDYIRFNSPLWSMIVRQQADLVGLYVNGRPTDDPPGFWFPLDPFQPLNSTIMQMPWNPVADAAQVALGGNPGIPQNNPAVCQDSPQNSESTNLLTMPPPAEGDSGGPCDTASYDCADKAITGWWPSPGKATAAVAASAAVNVYKSTHNNGPEGGTFLEWWEFEAPDGVSGVWTAKSGDTVEDNVLTFNELPAAASTHTLSDRTLTLTCDEAGSYLVALKNILYPIGTGTQGQQTKDQNLADNAKTSMIQIDCGTVTGTPVDKEVIWVKPVAVDGFNNTPSEQESTPEHLQLVVSDVVTVTVDEMKVYHPADGADLASAEGDETLSAEAPDGIDLRWVPEEGDTCTLNGEVVPCGTGEGGGPIDNCEDNIDNEATPDGLIDWADPECAVQVNDLELTWDEPAGVQQDVIRDLLVHCNPDALLLPQPQPVVLKAIDRPGDDLLETRPGDNVQNRVIKVWCYASDAEIDPEYPDSELDGIDDGTGLYVRWTGFLSNADVRKSGKANTDVGSPGDTDYQEYMVLPECFWIDEDNSAGHAPPDDNPSDGYISAEESRRDPDIPGGYAAIDADGDCLQNAATAQPSHKVDSVDTPTGTKCPALIYSMSDSTAGQGYIQKQYDTAADQDCDGLTDGVEAGWTSDPVVADTDGDNSSDFLEMREFSNPGNPDTDYDLLKDRPEDDYVAAAAGGNETNPTEAVNYDDNCPNAYNPTQANNDGQRIANGPFIPTTYTSNPNADTMGDACDTDDDNDNISDVAELQLDPLVWSGTFCTWGASGTGLNPNDNDTDNDHATDGIEHYMQTNPCSTTGNGAPKGVLADGLTIYFRGGGINVPALTLYGGVWDQTYSGSTPWTVRREMDMDGDTKIDADETTTGKDTDNDDNSATVPAEIADVYELKGFNIEIGKVDSDGDGCADWVEIADVNGDRVANLTDVYLVAQAGPGAKPTIEPDRTILDINKNGAIALDDVYLTAKNSQLVKPPASCLPLTSDSLR